MKFFIGILMVAFLGGEVTAQRSRLIVTTDIGQDPDDGQPPLVAYKRVILGIE